MGHPNGDGNFDYENADLCTTGCGAGTMTHLRTLIMMVMVMVVVIVVVVSLTMLTCAQLAVELEPFQRWLDLALSPDSEPEAPSLPLIFSLSMMWTQHCGGKNLYFTSD